MSQQIKAHTNEMITVTVLRAIDDIPRSIDLQMTPSPTYQRTSGSADEPSELIVRNGEITATVIVGIASHTTGIDFGNRVYPTPWQQVKKAAEKVGQVLKAFTSRKTMKAAGSAISGPVGIFMVLYIVKKSIMLMLSMALLINVNLAIVNMLPLPVLDGSQIVYGTYRLITGRELPRRLLIGLTNAFVLLLLMLMVFLVYRDTRRLFWKPKLPEGMELVSEVEAVKRGLLTVEQLGADRFRKTDLETLRQAFREKDPPELTP